MAIRHFGRGPHRLSASHFSGLALAATSSEPIPVIALMDVLRLRRDLHQQTLSQEAFHPGRNNS